MLSEKSGLLWVITLSLVTALLFFTVPNHLLSFDRDLIDKGEGWRIITGNLAHTNGWHLLLNLSGLAVLYSLFREYLTGWRLPVLVTGPSGTGKTAIAAWIHGLGRSNRPLVLVAARELRDRADEIVKRWREAAG